MCRALPLHTTHFQRAQQGLIRGYVCALVKPAVKTDTILSVWLLVATSCDGCSVNFPWLRLLSSAAVTRTAKFKTTCSLDLTDWFAPLIRVGLSSASSLLTPRCGSRQEPRARCGRIDVIIRRAEATRRSRRRTVHPWDLVWSQEKGSKGSRQL